MALNESLKLPEGGRTVFRFVSAVERGETPQTDDLRHVAHALRALLEPGATPKKKLDRLSERLGVKGKQGGARLLSGKTHDLRVSAVAEVLLLEREGMTKSDALKKVAGAGRDGADRTKNLRNWYTDETVRRDAERWIAHAERVERLIAYAERVEREWHAAAEAVRLHAQRLENE